MKFYYTCPVFVDTLQSLMNEYKDDTENTLCILGAIDLCVQPEYYKIMEGYDKVIVFNQEPYFATLVQDRKTNYLELLKKADEIWDYDEDNMKLWNVHGIYPTLHILKPYKRWDLYAPVEKDIDVLMYGTMSDRRKNICNHLKQKYNVVTIDYKIYGDMLDEYILRSKILLNAHVWNENYSIYQEQARMIRWIGAPCQIISEKSAHNYLGVPEKEYWELFLL